MKSVSGQISEQTYYHIINRVYEQLWKEIDYSTHIEVRNQLHDEVFTKVCRRVNSNLRDNIYMGPRTNIYEHLRNHLYSQISKTYIYGTIKSPTT